MKYLFLLFFFLMVSCSDSYPSKELLFDQFEKKVIPELTNIDEEYELELIGYISNLDHDEGEEKILEVIIMLKQEEKTDMQFLLKLKQDKKKWKLADWEVLPPN